MPSVGSENYLFFRPIFNRSDSAITVGVALKIICFRHTLTEDFGDHKDHKKKENDKENIKKEITEAEQ